MGETSEVQGSKRWLDVKGAAEALGLSRSAIYALVGNGQLACHRMGPNKGKLKFSPSDLEAYAESCRVGPKVKKPSLPKSVPFVSRYPLDGPD